MICAYDNCRKEFEPHRHNQKYCCSECCKDATNKRIKDKYYATKKRLNGETRVCITKNCGTVLSRYSENEVCSKCLAIEAAEQRDQLKRIFRAI